MACTAYPTFYRCLLENLAAIFFVRGPAGAATEPLVTKLRNSRRFTPLPLFVCFFQQARWFLIFLTARRPNT